MIQQEALCFVGIKLHKFTPLDISEHLFHDNIIQDDHCILKWSLA